MEDAANHIQKGLAAFQSGDYDTAISELEGATREDSANYRAFIFLGAAYAGKAKYNAAIGAFKMAEQINPNVASVHYNIGQAYEAAGVPDEAEYEYEYALRITPNYSKAQEALDSLRKRRRHDPSSDEL